MDAATIKNELMKSISRSKGYAHYYYHLERRINRKKKIQSIYNGQEQVPPLNNQ